MEFAAEEVKHPQIFELVGGARATDEFFRTTLVSTAKGNHFMEFDGIEPVLQKYICAVLKKIALG